MNRLTIVTWSEEALRRLHLMTPGSAVPVEVRYYFSAENGNGPVGMRLTPPIADPAMNGKAIMRLPGPSSQGEVIGAELIAEDGLVILTVTIDPPVTLTEADTLIVPVELA